VADVIGRRNPVVFVVGLFVALAVLASVSVSVAGARTIVIGRSVRGRAISAKVLGPDTAPRKILLVGCVHGNECAGIAILSALARLRPPVGIQLWLVPEMNPDGTAADTRQNADRVDLNRNFPFRWQPISDPTYYSGPHPLSEPETRTAVSLIRRIKPAVTIWYHQREDLSTWPAETVASPGAMPTTPV
jgi:murein peptide amidase A